MKCLRCGRALNGKMECECGHFYNNNLKMGKKHHKRSMTLIEILAIIIVIIVLIGFIFSNISNNNKIKREKQNSYCNSVCENTNYEIKDNICYCSNGIKYSIEE